MLCPVPLTVGNRPVTMMVRMISSSFRWGEPVSPRAAGNIKPRRVTSSKCCTRPYYLLCHPFLGCHFSSL